MSHEFTQRSCLSPELCKKNLQSVLGESQFHIDSLNRSRNAQSSQEKRLLVIGIIWQMNIFIGANKSRNNEQKNNKSVLPKAQLCYLNMNLHNRAKNTKQMQWTQGQILDMGCVCDPWHSPRQVSVSFAFSQTFPEWNNVPSSAASSNRSQLCTTRLSPFAAEGALSWTRLETEPIVMVTSVCLEVWCQCRCG